MTATKIYHLVPADDLQSGLGDAFYQPLRFLEDGFVHCAGSPETTVAVANDYFSTFNGQLVVLEITPEQLTSPLKVEAPAPLATSQGESRFETATLFPHVYGPIDRDAIQGCAVMPRVGQSYGWPPSFVSLSALLMAL